MKKIGYYLTIICSILTIAYMILGIETRTISIFFWLGVTIIGLLFVVLFDIDEILKKRITIKKE